MIARINQILKKSMTMQVRLEDVNDDAGEARVGVSMLLLMNIIYTLLEGRTVW